MSSDEPEIIDAEIVESDNLPAVIDQPDSYRTGEPIEGQGRDWETYAEPSRRCAGHKKTGERCKNAAILGSTVCRFHGGAARHVRAAARARLENAADLMAKQLLGIALTAEGEAVKLNAIKDALDRAGLKAPTQVEIGPTKPYEEVLSDVFDGISPMTRAESRRARGLSEEGDIQPASGLFEEPRDTSGYAPVGDGDSAEQRIDPPPAMAAHDDSPPPPPRQPRPRREGRQRQPQPAQHITGEDAIRAANAANRAIGALPEPRALPSPHKRYPRP